MTQLRAKVRLVGICAGYQQNLARGHVGCVLGQALGGFFKRQAGAYLGLEVASEQFLYLARDTELAENIAMPQPGAEPEAFHVLFFKDQRARIDRYTLHRETTVDQHAAASRLGAQNPARHLSRHRLKTDAGAEFVAQAAQSLVEAGVAAIEDVLRPHRAKERHLLRAP